ncbi:MAG: inorganic phosphate transporter [Chloroflexota bacterium]
MLTVVVVLALIFDFLNGLHDSSNVVATVISSRAMHPRMTLILNGLGNLLGPLLFGVAVAKTIGEGLLHAQAITMPVMLAALIAGILWNLITWYFGIPSSSSHALIGGLLGAAITSRGFDVVQLNGLWKILIALIISPPLGLLTGYFFTKWIFFLSGLFHLSPRVNNWFRKIQMLTSFSLSLSHGTNDAQKTMGVLTLALYISNRIPSFEVPPWVILASAGAIALGTSFGGWRLIHTLGERIFQIKPVHGFSSQVSGAVVILGAALLGGPVSTTQVMSSCIMGTGAAERISKVRWQVGQEMLVAWLITIPIVAVASAGLYFVITQWFI